MSGDPHEFATSLDGWAAELRVEAAARARAERGWHARVGTEEASFRGVLADLGARGRPVVLDLVGGRRHRGWLRLVGDDVVVVRTAVGPSSWSDVIVALRSIASVRPAPGGAAEVAAAPAGATTSLATVLATLAGSGLEVAVATAGNEPLVGAIDAVGDDVVALRLAGRAGTAYVRLGSVLAVSVPESG